MVIVEFLQSALNQLMAVHVNAMIWKVELDLIALVLDKYLQLYFTQI